MDLCGGLAIVGLVLFLVAVLGHGLWVLAAAMFRASGPGPRQDQTRPRRSCPGCGTVFFRWLEECPACGLDPHGKVARELRELEATVRQIQGLVEAESLDPAVGEEVYQKIEARQARLLGKGRALELEPGSRQHLEEDRQTARKLLASAPAAAEQSGGIRPEAFAEPPEIPVAVTAAEQPPPREQRSWTQMLAGFMEERNILWGELVGGLLIVGCSIALVISLWQTLEEIPYFPFLIFAAITAALFGAGLYTLSHWKLEATSRGLLVIATLLTPLDFLVLAGLSQGRPASVLDWGTELFALIAFTALVLRSSHILVGQESGHGKHESGDGTQDAGARKQETGEGIRTLAGRAPSDAWLLTFAVVGASATQLLVPRWLDLAQPVTWLFVLLSLAPVILQALAAGTVLAKLAWRGPLDERRVNKLYLFLGPTVFAVVVALRFIVYWSEHPIWALQHLAVPITVAAWPLLVCGAFVHDRLVYPPPSPQGGEAVPEVEGTLSHGLSPALAQLVGTVIALVGAGIMLGALVLAWPRPPALILIGAINAVVLGGVALCFRMAYAHGPSLACLAVAFLTAFHGLRGALSGEEQALGPRLLALAVSPASGTALALLAALLALTSEILLKVQRRLDGLVHIVAGGIAGLAAMVLVSADGSAAPGRAALVFGVCGLGGILVNARWRQPWLTWFASFAVLGSLGYTIHWWDPAWPLLRVSLLALLGHATLLMLAGFILEKWSPKQNLEEDNVAEVFVVPFRHTGLATSLLALWPLLVGLEWTWLPVSAFGSLWLAVLWLALAWNRIWPALFAACQAATTLAVLLAVSAWLHGQEWVGADARGLLHHRSLQAYGLGLAGLSLGWILARGTLSKSRTAVALLEPGWRGVDGAVLATVIIGQLLLTGAALCPEVLREVASVQLHAEIARAFQFSPGLDLTMAWMLLGLLVLVLLASLWGNRPKDAVLGWVLWALTLAGALAYTWREGLAAASMLRWALAFLFLGCSCLVWARIDLRQWSERLGIAWTADWDAARWARVLLLAGALAPILLITVLVAIVGFYGRQPAGPGPGTWFAWMGWTANVVIPLLLLVIGLTGHAARENASGYVFAAGLVLLATVTGGHALGVVTGGGALDVREGIYIGQLGIVVVALWALAWLWSRRWRNGLLLALQVSLALAADFVLLLPACVEVLTHGGGAWPEQVLQAGTWIGWFGLIISMAATIRVLRLWVPGLAVHLLGSGGLGLGILFASTAGPADPTGWRAYHLLTLAWTLLALGMLALSWTGSSLKALGPAFWGPERRQRAASILGQLFPVQPARRWVEGVGLCVILLALGGAWGDPGRPYWSCLATLAVCLLIGALAVWTRRPGYVYVSGLLLQVVAFLVWQAWLVDRWGLLVWFAVGPELFDHFLLLQILALATGALAWVLVEHFLRRRTFPIDLRTGTIPYAHAAALVAVQLLALLGLAALGSDFFHLDVHVKSPLVWWSIGVTALALLSCLWDVEAGTWGLPFAPLYALGLAAGSLAIHQWALPPRDLAWSLSLGLACYVFSASLLVQLSPRFASLMRPLRITPRSQGWLAGWFVPSQALVALAVLPLCFWTCLDFQELAERLAGPLALALVAVAAWLMTLNWQRIVGAASRLGNVQVAALVTLGLWTLTVVASLWALLDATVAAPWLHRNVLLLSTLVFLGAVYRFGLGRTLDHGHSCGTDLKSVLRYRFGLGSMLDQGLWTGAGRRLGVWLLELAAIVMAAVLAQEFFLYDPDLRTTPLAWFGVVLVALLLTGVMAALLWLAISQSNPGGFSDSARGRCVWAAELLLLLLWVHLRLNIPDLVPSFLGRNWTIVLMVLGFLGVGLGELCQRRGRQILAGPLRQTGLFMPLLPLLAYLVRPLAELSALGQAVPGLGPILRYLDRLPHHFALHALLWFLLALLYALTALLRRASAFGLLAALAANFGLWVIYAHHENLAFLLHPQIWLMPVGLILLAAEHLHRQRLSAEQAQGVRYMGILMIYLSSTADMFITGLGHSVLLPVVLALLAVLGVLAGILLRVRAFLFMGVAFLFLVVFAQIWHAAVDRAQTWVWWASGIVLGAAILTLFALFEKRRNDVLHMLEEIRRWR